MADDDFEEGAKPSAKADAVAMHAALGAPGVSEEANKYAPNWGRLHLKWGEALWWNGKRDDAKKQFAIASGLDLTPVEKSELARVMHG